MLTRSEVNKIVTHVPRLMGNKTVEQFVRISTDCEWSRTNWAEKETFY
jgi:hypothetical protein